MKINKEICITCQKAFRYNAFDDLDLETYVCIKTEFADYIQLNKDTEVPDYCIRKLEQLVLK